MTISLSKLYETTKGNYDQAQSNINKLQARLVDVKKRIKECKPKKFVYKMKGRYGNIQGLQTANKDLCIVAAI